MAGPEVLPAPRLTGEIEPQLEALADTRILIPARQAGYELSLVGASVLPSQQVIARTEHGAWLLVDHKDDPTRRPNGGKIRIPGTVSRRLHELDSAGVFPDHAWFAHELPLSWQEGDDLEDLIPPPAHLRKRDELLMRRIRTVLHGSAKAALTLGALALSPLAGLDPVLLGGVQHPEHPLVIWVELARWRWE